jgi:hypothetical protein
MACAFFSEPWANPAGEQAIDVLAASASRVVFVPSWLSCIAQVNAAGLRERFHRGLLHGGPEAETNMADMAGADLCLRQKDTAEDKSKNDTPCRVLVKTYGRFTGLDGCKANKGKVITIGGGRIAAPGCSGSLRSDNALRSDQAFRFSGFRDDLHFPLIYER